MDQAGPNPVLSWLTKYMRGTVHFKQILLFIFLTQYLWWWCGAVQAMQTLNYFQASNKVFVLDFRKKVSWKSACYLIAKLSCRTLSLSRESSKSVRRGDILQISERAVSVTINNWIPVPDRRIEIRERGNKIRERWAELENECDITLIYCSHLICGIYLFLQWRLNRLIAWRES